MKSAGLQDVMGEKPDPGDVVYADGAENTDEFPVIKQGDLSLHFIDGLFDGHTFQFRYVVLVYLFPSNSNPRWRLRNRKRQEKIKRS